jgi:hypothetical protein
MRKAIYLNVLTHVENTAKGKLSDEAAVREVKQTVEASKKKAKTSLSIEIKRARAEKGPDDKGIHVALLTYCEGDQDAPQNFTKLATDEMQKFLSEAFRAPTPSGLKVSVHSIEENTDAVDELADEADAQT